MAKPKRVSKLQTLPGCHLCAHSLCKYNREVAVMGYTAGVYDKMPYGCNSAADNFVPLSTQIVLEEE